MWVYTKERSSAAALSSYSSSFFFIAKRVSKSGVKSYIKQFD